MGGRICPWFCRRVRQSGCGALHRCRRECCCRVIREQGTFSPMPCASELATTGDDEKNALLRCLALFRSSPSVASAWGAARFLAHAPPVSLVFDVRLSVPISHERAVLESPRLTPSPLWCAAVMFSGSRGCQIKPVDERGSRGDQIPLRARRGALVCRWPVRRAAVVIRNPFPGMSIHASHVRLKEPIRYCVSGSTSA